MRTNRTLPGLKARRLMVRARVLLVVLWLLLAYVSSMLATR